MAKIVNLNCRNCGGGLSIAPDTDIFACGYCGTQQIVRRGGGTLSLKIVEKAIDQVKESTDKSAAELALVRLQKEQESIRSRIYYAEKAFKDDAIQAASVGAKLLAGILTVGVTVFASLMPAGYNVLSALVFLLTITACGSAIFYFVKQTKIKRKDHNDDINYLSKKVEEIGIEIQANMNVIYARRSNQRK